MKQLLLVASLLLSIGSPHFYAFANSISAHGNSDVTPLEEVQSFLHEQSIIRIGISKAPGNGHQSAGATVITRLRELGYQGLIEVVYDEDVAHKLEYLIPPFQENLGFQQVAEKKLAFIPKTKLSSIAPYTVNLGLMGADDKGWIADDLNVQNLLTLQPLGWKNPTTLSRKGLPVEHFDHLRSLGFIFSPPQPSDTSLFLQQEMAHISEFRKKIVGLNAIIDQRDESEIAPVYGHFIREGWQLVHYLRGLQWAITHYPGLFEKKIVVPVFSRFSDLEWQDAAREVDQLRKGIRSKTISTVTSETIKALSAGQILVVNVGPVTKSVFDYFYEISTIAPVVEGKNSINLMKILGRPYLPSVDFETFFWDRNVRPNPVVRRAASAMWTSNGIAPRTIASQIGRFIAEAKNPHSDVYRLFSQPGAQLDPVTNDKFIQGLLILVDRLKTKQRLGSSPFPARGVQFYPPLVCEAILMEK